MVPRPTTPVNTAPTLETLHFRAGETLAEGCARLGYELDALTGATELGADEILTSTQLSTTELFPEGFSLGGDAAPSAVTASGTGHRGLGRLIDMLRLRAKPAGKTLLARYREYDAGLRASDWQEIVRISAVPHLEAMAAMTEEEQIAYLDDLGSDITRRLMDRYGASTFGVHCMRVRTGVERSVTDFARKGGILVSLKEPQRKEGTDQVFFPVWMFKGDRESSRLTESLRNWYGRYLVLFRRDSDYFQDGISRGTIDPTTEEWWAMTFDAGWLARLPWNKRRHTRDLVGVPYSEFLAMPMDLKTFDHLASNENEAVLYRLMMVELLGTRADPIPGSTADVASAK